MKLYLSLIALFLSFSLFSQTGKVVRIKDGDTIVILDSLNVQHTIRVADIDCPERGQPFSTRAKQFVSKEVFGKMVRVESKGLDRFNRTIGFVLYDNKNLSLELLKMGLAWHYKYYSDDEEMARLESKAKLDRVGLWLDKNPINPYDWRKGERNQ